MDGTGKDENAEFREIKCYTAGGSPVIGKYTFGQDKPALLVSFKVICPFVEPAFHVWVRLHCLSASTRWKQPSLTNRCRFWHFHCCNPASEDSDFAKFTVWNLFLLTFLEMHLSRRKYNICIHRPLFNTRIIHSSKRISRSQLSWVRNSPYKINIPVNH